MFNNSGLPSFSLNLPVLTNPNTTTLTNSAYTLTYTTPTASQLNGGQFAPSGASNPFTMSITPTDSRNSDGSLKPLPYDEVYETDADLAGIGPDDADIAEYGNWPAGSLPADYVTVEESTAVGGSLALPVIGAVLGAAAIAEAGYTVYTQVEDLTSKDSKSSTDTPLVVYDPQPQQPILTLPDNRDPANVVQSVGNVIKNGVEAPVISQGNGPPTSKSTSSQIVYNPYNNLPSVSTVYNPKPKPSFSNYYTPPSAFIDELPIWHKRKRKHKRKQNLNQLQRK